MLRQSPASQGLDPSLPEVNEPAPDYVPPDAETGETLSPLAAFLTHAALESGDNQAQAGQDAIQLMTVHSAKGLEFDCVFISGLEEGLFPHENSMSDREGLEEERRLMYRRSRGRARLASATRRRACCMGRPATTSRAGSSTSA
jgi:DNA helicase-2/ATP-dependent DNA helicase PcrA